MSESIIVPFGKYKGKSIIELLQDTKYLDWCKLQPDLLKKHKTIFNVIYYQQLPDTNGKTPEHNKIQNIFLKRDAQIQFINYLNAMDKVNKIMEDIYSSSEYLAAFGNNRLCDGAIVLDYDNKVGVTFEGEWNWDLIIDTTMLESKHYTIKPFDKYQENLEAKLKIKHDLIYKDKCLEFERDRLNIEQNYLQEMIEFEQACDIYENNIKLYNQSKDIHENICKNSLRALENWKTQKLEYNTQLIKKFTKQYFGKELSSSIEMNCIDSSVRNLIDIKIDFEMKKYIDNNPKPVVLYGPTPPEPPKPPKTNLISKHEIIQQCEQFKRKHDDDYQKNLKWIIANHYAKILDIYNNYDDSCNYDMYSKGLVSLYVYHRVGFIYCEIKPQLGDDYPHVLRKMKNQKIMTTKKDRAMFVLLVKHFESDVTSKDELITIFRQDNIKVVFYDDVF